MRVTFIFHCILIIIFCQVRASLANDWPMWRYDAGRTAASPERLSKDLRLQWIQHFSPREPVWDDPLNQDLMAYDRIFEPIILGNMLFIGFNECDKVAAFDLETGQQKWEYFVDGPVRLPLAGWKNKIYFTSDDGYLYCLSADNGELLWKFNGGPCDRKLLGNKRLISVWPARGGVVIEDGQLYFSASIWPMMGTFIYSLDAETGRVIWRNEETSAHFIKQPHNHPAFAGIAPQGAFVISGDKLLVPGGRSVPACFDRHSGDTLYYHLAKYGRTGGSWVCANNRVFFNHDRDRNTHMYDLKSGKMLIKNPGKYPVVTDEMYYFSGSSIQARKASNPEETLWHCQVDASGDLILAGDFLCAAGENSITMLNLAKDDQKPRIVWKRNVDGKVSRLISGNGYLIAVTDDGKILAFAKKDTDANMYYNRTETWHPANQITLKAHSILDECKVDEGYALFYGVGDGDLLTTLAEYSKLSIVAVDSDIEKISNLRRRLNQLGFYGKRISLLQGSLKSVDFPQYFSSLTVIEDLKRADVQLDEVSLEKLIHSTRPYDGNIWLPRRTELNDEFMSLVDSYDKQPLTVNLFEESLVLTRNGPLPGSDNWTHQYGNIQNSVKSDDKLVKLPLGILWFGGNSNLDVLPRHGHGPPEQVVDGRLVIEGIDAISARDVYTGRLLWKVPLDSMETLRVYYNETYQDSPLESSYNQRHIPGANGRGSNFVLTKDFVYVLQGSRCLVLDIATGEIARIFSLPSRKDNPRPTWSYIGVYENYLIAGSEFVQFSSLIPLTSEEQNELNQLSLRQFTDLRDKANYDLTASRGLLIINRHNGEVLWQIESKHGFVHNSIVVANDVLFCLDKIPAFTENKLARRGIEITKNYRLLALNINTGETQWENREKVFGSWLGYSMENKLLLQATRPSNDMLAGEEGTRMIVYKAQTGKELWDRSIRYNNPPILHGNQIITNHVALDIFSGQQIYRRNPISQEILPWTYTRANGCNYNIACENLLSFRTSAAGFFDLKNDGGVGHFGGFKSGCTSNLIAANGVLNAPDYTRTCQCSYQNQTSLALVYMPGIEYWTTHDFIWGGEPVKRVGLNLNAPGDRMTENGILWLDFPSVGGPSPDIPVKMETENPHYIRRHSAFLPDCKNLPWVAASAITGIKSLEITLSEEKQVDASYTIHFYFIELEEKQSGKRVFNVHVQGKPFLIDFDITKETAGARRDIVKTLSGVQVEDVLNIQFIASDRLPECQSIVSGIEIIAEDLKE